MENPRKIPLLLKNYKSDPWIGEIPSHSQGRNMGFLATGLGMIVALLWGSGDILATLASRRLSAFRTTFLSQVISLFILSGFGMVMLAFGNITLTH